MQLSHKLHSIFVWNCRTAVKPYKPVEISVLLSKLSQNHLQFNAKKGILKEKRKKRTKRGSGTYERKRNHKCNVLSNQIAGGSRPLENDSVRRRVAGAGGRRDHLDDTRDASDDAGGRIRTAD